MSVAHPDLDASLLWVALKRSSFDGRVCRDYEVLDPAGSELLRARAFNWGRDIRVDDAAGTGCCLIRRSRLFPLTGRARVHTLPDMRPIGVVTRSGRFSDEAGTLRGRFRDARGASERAREGVLMAVGDALLGGDGDSIGSSPDSFVLDVAGTAMGALTRARLPFTPPELAAPARARSLARLVPKRAREAWQGLNAPRGWRFERATVAPSESGTAGLLVIAAALFAIELSRWT